MSASLSKLMAGTSTKYYTQTVSEVATDHGGGMASYYNTPGTPAGVWMGNGLGAIHRQAGTAASKIDISRVYDNLSDPDTGRLLSRIGQERIDAGEAVGGYDLTLTLPKSVDILWAAGDPHVRRTIMRCHKEAVQESVDWFEKREAYSRTGKGGIIKQHASGIIAAAFTHWDSREGDPHLHDHVLISNIVERADGNTGALDGKAVYSATVAISERHTNLLMDKLTDSLGVQWRQREMPGTKSCVYDLVGIDDDLIDTFSRRNAEINKRVAKEVAKLRADGIEPDAATMKKLHRRAWRLSRKAKPKEPKSLHELMDEWNEELARHGYDPRQLVRDTIDRGGLNQDIDTLLEQPDIVEQAHQVIKQGASAEDRPRPAAWLADLLRASVADNAALHSVQHGDEWEQPGDLDPFSVMHEEAAYNTTTISENVIRSSAERLTRGIRLREGQRDQLTDLLVEEEKKNLILLSEDRYTLSDEQRKDPGITINGNRAVTDFPEGNVYATKELLAAEERFKKTALSGTYQPATGWDQETLEKTVEEIQTKKGKNRYKHPLAPDQKEAVVGLLSSTKPIVALAGAAGTGKTTTLRCLSDIVSRKGGRQVVAYAPTAVAAQELGSSLGVPADTLAKLLYEDERGNLDQRILMAEAEYKNAGSLTSLGADGLTPRNLVRRYRRRERARQRLASLRAEKGNLTIPERGIVIVDEAGMANTFDLQHLSELCAARHAKMILVGDDKQLNTVGGGAGAFTWVTGQKKLVSELDSIWRFKDGAEAQRSKLLRSWEKNESTGDYQALAEYDQAGRIHADQSEHVEDVLIGKVAKDYDQGISALLIVGSNEGISDMNERISRQRQASGSVEKDPRHRVILADGSTAGKGDVICTRNNDRRIRTRMGGYVHNNDIWIVDDVVAGSIRCHPTGREGDSVMLPASYVDHNVIGGYAVTPHRSQGKTVDRGYYYIPKDQAGISSANTLYVAMTRGRERNDVYVATKAVKEMMTGTEDTYELAAWRLRNKVRYEKIEHKKFWDDKKGPKPGEGWYTSEDLLPSPHQQAMFTLHQVMDHQQTGTFASEWARHYQQSLYTKKRLQAEWTSYRRILSERQIGHVLDKDTMDRLKADPGYGLMLDAYANARERSAVDANGTVKRGQTYTAINIANLLLPEGRKKNEEVPPHYVEAGNSTPPDQARVIDLMNQTCGMYIGRKDLAEQEIDFGRAFGPIGEPWEKGTMGPVPPFNSPRLGDYRNIIEDIREYRAIHRISDPQRAFGPSSGTDGWKRDIQRRISDYHRPVQDPESLAGKQDQPQPITHGRRLAVKAGRGIILDYTDGGAAGKEIRIPVTADTANGTINQIRSIRADGPSRMAVKTGPDSDLSGVWRALTPAERGKTVVIGPDGEREPLWKGMMDSRAGESGQTAEILQGLDIEQRHQAEAWLDGSPEPAASHGETLPADPRGEAVSLEPDSPSPDTSGPTGPEMG